jgi:hypothetical protein
MSSKPLQKLGLGLASLTFLLLISAALRSAHQSTDQSLRLSPTVSATDPAAAIEKEVARFRALFLLPDSVFTVFRSPELSASATQPRSDPRDMLTPSERSQLEKEEDMLRALAARPYTGNELLQVLSIRELRMQTEYEASMRRLTSELREEIQQLRGLKPAPRDSIDVAKDIAPFLAVGVAFLGFVGTTALAWSKEARERKQGELELEKQRLEVERLRSELTRRVDADA